MDERGVALLVGATELALLGSEELELLGSRGGELAEGHHARHLAHVGGEAGPETLERRGNESRSTRGSTGTTTSREVGDDGASFLG